MFMNIPTDSDTRLILNTGHLSTAFLGFSLLWMFFMAVFRLLKVALEITHNDVDEYVPQNGPNMI